MTAPVATPVDGWATVTDGEIRIRLLSWILCHWTCALSGNTTPFAGVAVICTLPFENVRTEYV